jgi:hypothetical protein
MGRHKACFRIVAFYYLEIRMVGYVYGIVGESHSCFIWFDRIVCRFNIFLYHVGQSRILYKTVRSHLTVT